MENNAIIAAAVAEIEHPVFAATEQFLEIHQIKRDNGIPVVVSIRPCEEDTVIVYFAVEKELFYFAVNLTVPKLEVCGTGSVAWHRLYLYASTENLTLQQLKALTTLSPTEVWQVGDRMGIGTLIHNDDGFICEPYPAPADFDTKLDSLLDFLEQDSTGVQALVDQADAHVWAATGFHNGNSMLNGLHLSKAHVQRLAALNLEIVFDLYAEGNPYK